MSVILTTVAAMTLAAPAGEKAALQAMNKACACKAVPGRHVLLETTRGKVTIVLFDKNSPKTAENFAKLVKKGFYDGTPFHRVIDGFVAQGGDPTGTGMGDPGYKVPFEKNNLKHIRGALGMARSQPLDSAGSQFFIDYGALVNLDQVFDTKGTPTGGYVVFGMVVDGMAAVDKFVRVEAGNPPGAKPDRIVRAKLM
jgi:peptidylprolyl isomerase